MRELLLHIGAHKSGTTFIQNALPANAARLAAQGVLYPVRARDGRGAHWEWTARLLEDADAAGAALEAAAATQSLDRVLLSDENLLYPLLTDGGGAAMLATLGKRFRVRLLLALRRQDAFWESYYAQCQRDAPQTLLPPGMTIERFDRQWYCDYLGLYRRLDGLGGARLHVGAHVDDPRDRFATFAALGRLVEIDASDFEAPRGTAGNPRESRRLTLFLSELDKSRMPAMPPTLRALRLDGAIGDDGRRCLLSPADRRAFWAARRDDNLTLCAIVDDPALTDTLCEWRADASDETWFPAEPIRDDERRRARAVIAAVARRRNRLNRLKAAPKAAASALEAFARRWFG